MRSPPAGEAPDRRSRAEARAAGLDPAVIVFTTALRDFAVAATLARQAFGPRAAGVGRVYRALMLLTGALAATLLRRRTAQARSS